MKTICYVIRLKKTFLLSNFNPSLLLSTILLLFFSIIKGKCNTCTRTHTQKKIIKVLQRTLCNHCTAPTTTLSTFGIPADILPNLDRLSNVPSFLEMKSDVDTICEKLEKEEERRQQVPNQKYQLWPKSSWEYSENDEENIFFDIVKKLVKTCIDATPATK